MIHRALGRLAAVLPLLLLVPSAGAATVSGRVLDSAGAPVPGAKVVWEKYRTDEEVLVDETKGAAPAPLGETKTDDGGRFQVKLDKPGIEVAIRVLPGALAGALLAGPYDSSEDVEVDDIELPAAEKISGRVTDEAGKPVAGARVRLTSGSFFEEEDVPAIRGDDERPRRSFHGRERARKVGQPHGARARLLGLLPVFDAARDRRTGHVEERWNGRGNAPRLHGQAGGGRDRSRRDRSRSGPTRRVSSA